MFIEPMEEHTDEGIIQLDEGWWDSILAEEEKFVASTNSSGTIKNQSIPVEKNNWQYLEGIYKNDAILKLMVTGFNRGGLLIQGEGVQGFVPVSHLVEAPCNMSEEDRKKFLSTYNEKELSVKIIEFVPDEERIVFSERAATAGEGKRKLIFENIHPGDNVTGVVTNITDFGVFLDLGGLEGLIHVSELSWGRVEFPGDIVCVGQRIEALVLNVTEQNSRIALSYKRLIKNPWESIESVYSVGDVVSVKITSITKFGAFARLKEGVEGLIHVSTIELPQGITDFTTLIHKDDCVSVKILHIDSDKKRIGLCLQGD